MSRRTRDAVLLVVPLLGAVVLALVSRREDLYRLLVREDSVLEWAQVVAYGAVVTLGVVGARRLWRRGDRTAGAVVVVLAAAALMSVGEELAWGQRLSGFGTPELFAQNRQGETTLHNDARFDVPSRVALLLAGLYGVVMSVAVRGRTPFAPPRQLIGFFAVVSAYFAFRLLFLEHPTYIEAKYSEWPELCLAFAVAYWCADLVKRSERPRAGPVPRNGRRSATPLHVTDLRGRVSCEQDAITSARERRRAAAPDRATPRSS